MTTKTNAINWFELFTTDFDRAKRFYDTILQTELQTVPTQNCEESKKSGIHQMAVFPYNRESGIGGAISKIDGCTPGAGGTVVYLNVEGDLQGVLDRTPAAVGEVIKPLTPIGEHGFIGIIKDTEEIGRAHV